eukprot:780487_1
MKNTLSAVILATLFLLIVSMLMVVISVFKRSGKNKISFWLFRCRRDRGISDEDEDGDGYDDGDDSTDVDEDAIRTKRVILRQAILYVGAFILTYVFFVIGTIIPGSTPDYIRILRSFFGPLQGFFTALIFLYQKVHTLRRSLPDDCSVLSALKTILRKPSSIPEVLISDID